MLYGLALRNPNKYQRFGVADVARRRGIQICEARCGAERRPGTCLV